MSDNHEVCFVDEEISEIEKTALLFKRRKVKTDWDEVVEFDLNTDLLKLAHDEKSDECCIVC